MFPIGDQIDPEIPTDPNELVLYKKYGKNWRDVISGRRYSRDRGGNLDRGMRFMHTTPEGFMTRPTPPMSQQQIMQSDIDQSGYMSQMQKIQDDYNRMLQEWYSLTGSSAYQEQQDYYAGNYEDMYGGGGGSQDPQYYFPPATDANAAAAAATSFTDGGQSAASGLDATTDLSKLIGLTSSPTPALTGQSAYNAQMAQSQAREQASPAYRAPAPALVPAAAAAAAAPTLNSFITRYDRDVQDGKVKAVAPVKTVAPVQNMVRPSLPTAKKPVTTTKKVKAI